MMTRNILRQQIRQKRNALSAEQQFFAAQALQQKLSEHKKVQQAQHIAIYLTNDGELETNLFIQWCWQQKKQVYLPVIHPFCKGHLLFLQYHQQTLLVKNKFGIAEPKLDVRQVCPVEKLDVLCTPLVAFDKEGARLGMGGGFYDRTLATWFSQQKLSNNQPFNFTSLSTLPLKLYPIGLAHDCQQVDCIPSEQWDIPLPEIMTPSQSFHSRI